MDLKKAKELIIEYLDYKIRKDIDKYNCHHIYDFTIDKTTVGDIEIAFNLLCNSC